MVHARSDRWLEGAASNNRNVSTTHMGIHALRGSYWGHFGISPLFSVSEV